MKRLGIFFFYEKNGDVDDFIFYETPAKSSSER